MGVDEVKVLLALQRYYLGDISFERVAEEAGISVYELIEFVRQNDLRLVLTDEDRVEGLEKVSEMLEKHGIKSALRFAREAKPL